MPRRSTAGELQDQVVAAYLDGDLIEDIEQRYRVGRSTIYWLLRRSGQVPSRRQSNGFEDEATLLAGLRELVRYLEEENARLVRENQALKKQAAVRERADARRQRAG